MTEHKISYLPLWEKYLELFEEAQIEERQIGQLILMMMQYQFRGQEPEQMDPGVKPIWFFLKRDLDFARKQYLTSVENGKKGGRKKKKAAEEKPEETCENPEKPGKTQNNPEKGNTITESITRTISNTITNTETESEPESNAASWPLFTDPAVEFMKMKETAMKKLKACC